MKPVSHDDARKTSGSTILFSTACWRGYIGTWEVRDDRFYLVDIEGLWRKEGDDPILADWFTGTLRIPRGEMLHYVHMGFGSVYEKELHIKIEAGRQNIDGKLVIADVIDIDSWRIWPGGDPSRQLDKQNFRDGHPLSEVSDNYALVAELTRAFVAS